MHQLEVSKIGHPGNTWPQKKNIPPPKKKKKTWTQACKSFVVTHVSWKALKDQLDQFEADSQLLSGKLLVSAWLAQFFFSARKNAANITKKSPTRESKNKHQQPRSRFFELENPNQKQPKKNSKNLENPENPNEQTSATRRFPL